MAAATQPAAFTREGECGRPPGPSGSEPGEVISRKNLGTARTGMLIFSSPEPGSFGCGHAVFLGIFQPPWRSGCTPVCLPFSVTACRSGHDGYGARSHGGGGAVRFRPLAGSPVGPIVRRPRAARRFSPATTKFSAVCSCRPASPWFCVHGLGGRAAVSGTSARARPVVRRHPGSSPSVSPCFRHRRLGEPPFRPPASPASDRRAQVDEVREIPERTLKAAVHRLLDTGFACRTHSRNPRRPEDIRRGAIRGSSSSASSRLRLVGIIYPV